SPAGGQPIPGGLLVNGGNKSRTRTFWRHARTERHMPKSAFGHVKTPADSASANGHGARQTARDLRSSLQNLGPLYSYFARYLSSRIDLLLADCCRALALTPDVAPPVSPHRVARILAADLGRLAERVFATFDPVPFRSDLLAQHHRATL